MTPNFHVYICVRLYLIVEGISSLVEEQVVWVAGRNVGGSCSTEQVAVALKDIEISGLIFEGFVHIFYRVALKY
jgi:3-isopropylmalate dehydratase small subunit